MIKSLEISSGDVHRKQWHDRHPEASKPLVKPKEQEPKAPRTRIIRAHDWLIVFILLCKAQGFFRQLSVVWWGSVFKTATRWWLAALWVRGAYKYARWRLSPYERHSAPLIWKRTICEGCNWRVVVDDVAYCDACNCPKKPRAALARKNQRTYPHCPKGKHPGSRVDPYAKMQPCFGCGGRKRNGNTEMGT